MASKSIIDTIIDPVEFKTPQKILALVGALLIIIGLFLPWVNFDFTMGEPPKDEHLNWKGIGLNGETKSGDWNYTLEQFSIDTAYPPVVVLVFGILCLVGAAISSKFKPLEKFYPFLLIALGLLVLILVFLQYNSLSDGMNEFNDVFDKKEGFEEDKFSFGIGLYLGLVGGLLVAVGGALPMIQKKMG